MTPEAGPLFNKFKDVAASTAQSLLEQTVADFQTAAGKKDVEAVARLNAKLQQLNGLPEAIAEVSDPITSLLLERGIVSIDLPIQIVPVAPHAVSEPEVSMEAKRVVREFQDRRKYVDHAPARILGSLLEQDKKGKFVYTKIVQIAESITRRKKDYDDAANYIGVEKRTFAQALLDIAKQTKATTVAGVLEKYFGANLQEIKDLEWKPVYEQMRKLYGALSPEQFIATVLNRFRSEREQAPSRKADVTLQCVIDNPVVELVLCGALLRNGTLKNIQEKILKGKNPKKVVLNAGWDKENLPLRKAFVVSQKRMSHQRRHNPITINEAKLANDCIMHAVHDIREHPRLWHKLPSEYSGFNFLVALIQQEPTKVSVLRDILFSKGIIGVDKNDIVVYFERK